jgi:hypothetical protein
MVDMLKILDRIRNLILPSELRLNSECDQTDPTVALLLSLLSEFDKLAPPSSLTLSEPLPPPSGGIPKAIAIETCNELFRMDRHLVRVKERSGDAGDMRKQERSVTKLRTLLSKNKVEYIDVTGQVWTPSRVDIEVIGSLREDATLTDIHVERCERPVVMIDDKIEQQARGTLVGPLRNQNNTN